METAKFILFLMLTLSSLYATKGQWLWPCEETVDCGGLSEVECVSGECRCPVGFQIDAAVTGCIAAAPYVNSECTVDYQCRHLMTGYSCYNGVCSCLSGHAYMHGRCWETVGFGEPCVSSRQCHDSLMPLSLQCKSSTCSCADGYYSRERGLCRKIVSELNGACILDQDCQISSAPDAVCSLKTLTCVESEGDNDGVIFDTKIEKIQSFFDTKLASFRPSKMAGVEDEMAVGDNKMAAPKAGVKEGDPCLTDEECAGLGEASCLYRQCICRQGYFPNGNQTICGAELGIQVTEEKYCAGFGAKLLNGICDCPAGYFYQENVRDCKKPSRRLGDSCLDDRSCFTFGRAGKCSESEETSLRTCGCDSTLSLMNEDKQICELFDKSIGDGCENTEECPTNVQCIDKVCNCIGDETPNTAGTACLLGGLEIGDQCTLDTQCKDKNSKCKNGLCTCNDDYYVNEGVCEVGLGGSCTSGEECTVANSVCDEDSKKCSCGDGYVSEDNGQCFKLATSWTDSCQLDDQCRPALGDNSTVYCWEGTCKCTADSHLRDHKCWPKIELRGVCARSSECYLKEDISRTECRNSLCQCQIGFTELYNPDICSAGETSRILAFLPILSLLMTLLLFK